MGFIDRLTNGFALAGSSWRVLRASQSLIIFPILSGLSCLLVLASFAAPFVVHPEWLDFLARAGHHHQRLTAADVPPWAYAVTFAFYFCNYFVMIFFNSALISAAMVGFMGEKPTVSDGFSAAMNRLPQIAAWALVSATVGMLLSAVENSNRRFGTFIRSILGAVWTICTFFVVPVLVVEKVGPFQAVMRSMSILTKTWGESLAGGASIRFSLFLLAIPLIAVAFAGVLMLGPAPVLGIFLLGLAAVSFLALCAIGSALDGILVAALYLYAVYGDVPDGFPKATLAGAFQPSRE
jgi:Family of unknown function (DUF6159)